MIAHCDILIMINKGVKQMIKGNLMYGQSGGPSPVINASAYGVIKEALLHSETIENVFLLRHGISGVLEENFVNVKDVTSDIELLKHTPASALGSVRFKLKSHLEDLSVYEKMLEVFKKYNVRFFIYNGGNDSMDTCVKLSDFLKTVDYEMVVIGVPKTVDNDLPLTDHTPGFGSAAKYIINTLMQVKLDSNVYPHGKVTIVEIMGRHAGWLTAAAHVATNEGNGPDLVYIPETVFCMKEFMRDVKNIYEKTHNCLIAVSEGIKDKSGAFIGAMSATIDAFGHKQLGGVAMYLGDLIESELGISTRSIELSTVQRSASMCRSNTDVNEAIEVGRHAVQFALNNEHAKMVGIRRLETKEYQVEYVPVDVYKVANLEQVIPPHMIDGNNVTQAFYDYIYPLIEGEFAPIYKNGVQQFFKL